MNYRKYPLAPIVLAAAVLLGACTGTSEPGESTPTTATEATTPDTASTDPETGDGTPEIPDSPVGIEFQWVMDLLAADDGPDEAEASQRFAPEFLAQVPADELASTFDQIRSMGPYELATYQENGPGAEGELTDEDGQRYLLTVGLGKDERIAVLTVAPLLAIPEIATVDDAASAVSEAAGSSAFLLAEVSEDGSACSPVAEAGADQLLPIGSIFKLYVLGAVVQSIEDGDLAWDQTLTLTEELKSLPSGTLQDEPAGTEVTVRQATDGMIAISDNTAADMLIDAVGRDAVEDAIQAMGHSAPEVNAPLLSTRELFQLAYSDPELLQDWNEVIGEDPISADPAVSKAQRELVDELPEWDLSLDPSLAASVPWTAGLEWFATAQDLCAAHLYLQEVATSDAGAPVPEILGQNPGLSTVEGIDQIAFKGGSTTGEIAGSWHVETTDGSRYVLVMQIASPQGVVPDARWFFDVADQVTALAVAGE